MDLDQVLLQAFLHFLHLDHSNAALHATPVRYSPLTIGVAQQLDARGVSVGHVPGAPQALETVLSATGPS